MLHCCSYCWPSIMLCIILPLTRLDRWLMIHCRMTHTAAVARLSCSLTRLLHMQIKQHFHAIISYDHSSLIWQNHSQWFDRFLREIAQFRRSKCCNLNNCRWLNCIIFDVFKPMLANSARKISSSSIIYWFLWFFISVLLCYVIS